MKERAMTKEGTNIEVEVISTETIKPSSPTPSHLKAYKISFLDQVIVPGHYIPFFTYYTPPIRDATKAPNSISGQKILKDTLSETLTRFYPLAGRVQNQNDYVINCNDKGIVFSTARVNNCAMTDFLSSSQPKVEFLHQFLPTLPAVTKLGADDDGKDDDDDDGPAQLAIQLNMFSCGGVALCVCFRHDIIDATTISALLNCWSSIILAKDNTKYKGAVFTPDYSAPSLFPQRGKESLPAYLTLGAGRKPEPEVQIVTKRIVFKATAVEGLRAIAASEHVPKPSRFEATACFIWKHCMAASGAIRGSRLPSLMCFPADIRRRMVPPLPRYSVGNILSMLLTDKYCTDGPAELDGLVSLLRKALERFKDKFVPGHQGPELYEAVSQSTQDLHGSVSTRNANPYVFNSWCDMGLNEVDLGWGKPAWVSFIGGASRFKNVTFLFDGGTGRRY
ncbi:hypothetical protein RJ639_034179 [Escallonia herrerae]|uniref:Uncharacterized protein n=1 Tax=Escallonia herrerae TaxID=1293975 RepID=A0AA89BE47_9ASTE|nr:hypothetical protein RJ639_034179 [Escallonia herrerae]